MAKSSEDFRITALPMRIGLANILYFLGPAAEKLLRPKDTARFRVRLFALGTGFSVLLSFMPVIGNTLAVITYPSGTEECPR